MTATETTGQAVQLDLARAGGRTLIIATHDPAIAERCDRMIRIRDGKIAGEGVGS